MKNKIKEFLEYRKNKKIAKRELAKIAATALPTIREVSTKSSDIIKFVIKLANSTKNVDNEKLIEMVLNEVSTTLQTNNARIIEILSYIATLQPEDIRKILMHAVVETVPDKGN